MDYSIYKMLAQQIRLFLLKFNENGLVVGWWNRQNGKMDGLLRNIQMYLCLVV